MSDITSTSTITESSPNAGLKRTVIETAATAAATDTIVMKLGSYGIGSSGFLSMSEVIHTTDASVIIHAGQQGAQITTNKPSTTAVAAGVLTITIGTQTGTHVFEVIGK